MRDTVHVLVGILIGAVLAWAFQFPVTSMCATSAAATDYMTYQVFSPDPDSLNDYLVEVSGPCVQQVQAYGALVERIKDNGGE